MKRKQAQQCTCCTPHVQLTSMMIIVDKQKGDDDDHATMRHLPLYPICAFVYRTTSVVLVHSQTLHTGTTAELNQVRRLVSEALSTNTIIDHRRACSLLYYGTCRLAAVKLSVGDS